MQIEIKLDIFLYKSNLPHQVQCANYGNTGCGVFKWWGTKLERFLHKNQHTQRKILNFEFWINGELSKIGLHYSNKVKVDFIKKCQQQ